MKKILICLMMLFLVVGCSSSNQKNKKEETVKKEEKTEEKEPVNTSIKLNFAGDCILGNYAGQAYDGSFNQEYAKQGNDATYFSKFLIPFAKASRFSVPNSFLSTPPCIFSALTVATITTA